MYEVRGSMDRTHTHNNDLNVSQVSKYAVIMFHPINPCTLSSS